MRNHCRRARTIASSGALALLTLAAVAAAGARVTMTQANTPAPARPAGAPVSRPSSNGPINVAVVLGASGTVGSDALAPYEVFASSPRLSV